MKLKKEFRLGLLVILVLAATIIVINYLRGVDILGRETVVVAYFDDVESLVASAPVQIRGFRAGRVSDVDYMPEADNFRVECSIRKDFKIPEDSRMVICSTSLLGGKGVKIILGKSDTLVHKGSVLLSGSELDLISSLTNGLMPLLESAKSLIDSASITVNNVNDLLGESNRANIRSSLNHLNATLAHARSLAASLDGKSAELESLIDNLDLLGKKLGPIADSAQTTIDNLNGVTAKLDSADLTGTIRDIDSAVKTIDRTIEEIRVPLDELLTDADAFIRSVKENPKKKIKLSVF